MKQGIVMRSTGAWYDILTETGHTYQGRLRGKLRLKGLKVTNPIAVGDTVNFELENETENTVAIQDFEKRENYLVRKSTRKRGHGHIIAANLDQILIIATMVYPRTSAGFIDRILVSAESFRIPVIILFNKADLLDEKARTRQEKFRSIYEPLNYACLETSALKQRGLREVETRLEGKKSLIVGHSGVGKSTLLNQIAPEIEQKTQEISAFSEKGMHTTTFAEMFEIRPQTFIIDTPGIKEMGLMQIGDHELAHYFPEMRRRIGECKYHNCTHHHEPKCAIRDAVEGGAISPIRYKNYLRMLTEEED